MYRTKLNAQCYIRCRGHICTKYYMNILFDIESEGHSRLHNFSYQDVLSKINSVPSMFLLNLEVIEYIILKLQ